MTFKVMEKKVTGEKFDFYLVQICGRPCEASLNKDIRAFRENYKPE